MHEFINNSRFKINALVWVVSRVRGEYVDEMVEAVACALADADASAAVRTLHRVEEVALVGGGGGLSLRCGAAVRCGQAPQQLPRALHAALVGAALPAAPRRAARLQRALQCAARVRLARARDEHCAVLRHDQLVPATSRSNR